MRNSRQKGTQMSNKVLLGDLLKQKGLISDKHIRYALIVQKVTREKIGEILVRTGIISEYDLIKVLAEQTGLEYVDIQKINVDMNVLKYFNRNFCLTNKVFPLYKKNGTLIVATCEIPDVRIKHALKNIARSDIKFVMAEQSKIIDGIYHYFYFLENPIEQLIEREINLLKGDTTRTISPDNLINYLITFAIKKRATDIHLRPMEDGIQVTFRVDGVLDVVNFLPKELYRIITAIKLKAGMDISEQRVPQDGRWSIKILEKNYDIRVSSVVTPNGENIVMRLLSQERATFSLEELGFFPEDLKILKDVFNEPHGIVLLTGPTGSGKSTTLVAGLNTLDLMDKNVLTIENPIEYVVPLARQTQVNEAAGYDFSNAVRYFLRHDPDVILIGEIRDKVTAETAITAANTGHLVLSTIHSNTAVGVIPRLKNFGIDDLAISETLICAVNQRLLRVICPYCKYSYSPSKEEKEYIQNLLKQDVDVLYKGRGCKECGFRGYWGRTVIYEIFIVDPDIRKMIERGDKIFAIEEEAKKKGFVPILINGLKKVVNGTTTLEELRRVIGGLR